MPVGLEGLLMTDKTIPAFVLRSARVGGCVLVACLALAFSAPLAGAQETVFAPVNLYHTEKVYDEASGEYVDFINVNDYVKVVLHYEPVGNRFQYTYVVTNHSTSSLPLWRFFFTSVEVSDLTTFGDEDWQPSAASGWGHKGPQNTFIYGVPYITPHDVWVGPGPDDYVTGSQLRWETFDNSVALYPGTPEVPAVSIGFGFTSTYDISRVGDAEDIANAYLVSAYTNDGADLLYGPDPNPSPGGGQVPEWSSVMLGLVGLGGMSRRFRRR